jgi:hypothetical protein
VHCAEYDFKTQGISFIDPALIISLQMPIIGNYMSENDSQDFSPSIKADQSPPVFITLLQAIRDKSKTKQPAVRSEYGK